MFIYFPAGVKMMFLFQIYGMLLPNKKTTVLTVVFAAMGFTNRQTRLYGIK